MQRLLIAATVAWMGACAPSLKPAVRQNPSVSLCRTDCGMLGINVDCAELKAVEFQALVAFDVFAGFDAGLSCMSVNGWGVMVHADYNAEDRKRCDGDSWLVKNGGDVWCASGYTHLADRWMEIGSAPLLTGSLTHEIGHVLDVTFTGHVGHCKWSERGIRDAIKAVTGFGPNYVQAEQDSADCPK